MWLWILFHFLNNELLSTWNEFGNVLKTWQTFVLVYYYDLEYIKCVLAFFCVSANPFNWSGFGMKYIRQHLAININQLEPAFTSVQLHNDLCESKWTSENL